VQLVWAAASEGNVLAAAVDRMTDQLRAMGPLRWQESVLAPAAGANGHAATSAQPAAAGAAVKEGV
jgi:hypothetical protein